MLHSVGTLSANECTSLIDFDYKQIKIIASPKITAADVTDLEAGINGRAPYLRLTAGNVFFGKPIPDYGITIDAASAIRPKTGVNSAETPTLAMAQNLTQWDGSATYGTLPDQYKAAPGPPSLPAATYQIMDSIGGSIDPHFPTPIWTPYATTDPMFNDSPSIHVPLRYLKEGPLLTFVSYIDLPVKTGPFMSRISVIVQPRS